MDEFKSHMHEGVGVSAGGVSHDSRVIPVVTLSFMKDESANVDLANGIYDPTDGRWHNFTLSVRAARQLISDMKECVDTAIRESR